MKSAARIIAAFISCAFLATFPVYSLAAETTAAFPSNISTDPDFYNSYCKQSIQYWDKSTPNGTIVNYHGWNSIEGGIDGIRFTPGYPGSTLVCRAQLNHIIAGKTYVIIGHMAFGSNTGREDVELMVMDDSDNDITAGDSQSNYASLSDQSGNSVFSFTYSFKTNITTSNNIVSNSSPSQWFVININTKTSNTVSFGIKNLQIKCLDDIVYNALRSIHVSTSQIEEYEQEIIDILRDQFYSRFTDGASGNIPLISHNIVVLGQWLLEQTNAMRDNFEDFYDEFGEDFSIALYNMLAEALIGDPDEYTTDPAVSDSVSEYNAIESQLMQDKSADMSQALGQGTAAMTNNNALAWIKYVVESTVFSNTKITTYIIFALGMGLVVLTLGRKIKV